MRRFHFQQAHAVNVFILETGVAEAQLHRFDGAVGDRPADVLGKGQVPMPTMTTLS